METKMAVKEIFRPARLAMRAVSAWLAAACVCMVGSGLSFSLLAFVRRINPWVFGGVFIGVFAALSLLCAAVPKSPTDTAALTASGLCLIFTAMLQYGDSYFAMGVLLCTAIFLYYLIDGDKLHLRALKFSATTAKAFLIVAALCYFLFVGVLTVMRYLNYQSFAFDFGIFAQMFYNMKETGLPNTTIERDMFLSHFAVHISPAYYLLLPFYWLFPNPAVLQLLQAAVLASGVIPLWLLCRHYRLSNKLGACLGVAYCAYPALIGGCFYDIHENMFLTPMLLWLFYFYEKNKNIGIFIFAVLTLTVKEDAAIYVACFGLYVFFSRKDYKRGTALFFMSVAYFFAAVTLLNSFGQGAMMNRYENYMADQRLGLAGVVLTLLQDPALVLSESFTDEKLMFLLLMLAPLAFLPLMNKKPSQLLLLIPFLVISLMSNYPYQHSLHYQYVFGVTAFFFYLAVINLSLMPPDLRRKLAVFAAVGCILLSASQMSRHFGILETFFTRAEENRTITACLQTIPKDASVEASTCFVPNLSQREKIYRLKSNNEAEYVVIDLRPGRTSDDTEGYWQGFLDSGYRQTVYEENLLVILKKA